MKCVYLDCGKQGTHKLVPQYGPASWWCHDHGHAALDVESRFANRQSSGPRLTPGKPLTLPRIGIPREATAS